MNISMTMAQKLYRWTFLTTRPAVAAVLCVGILLSLATIVPTANAQRPNVHFNHAGNIAPGAIGRRQLTRGGPLRGYIQPVEITAPKGAMISLAAGDGFDTPQKKSRKAGMYISPVYRLRVTHIPSHPGTEIYPTIEVINRMYPPLGKEAKFPIPIEITKNDLKQVIAGKFITKVIYMENPKSAMPMLQDPKKPAWLEASSAENPLVKADQLGRPMAILRIGGRQPDLSGPSQEFLYGSPNWIDLMDSGKPEEIQAAQRLLPRKKR